MSCNFTRLLVSVRSGDEASAAVDGGADLIDVKNPDHGSLGMATTRTVDQIVDRVAGRRPVSMALGEWHEAPTTVPDGVKWVKIGLARAPRDWRKHLARRLMAYHPANLVAVAYADHERAAAPPLAQVLDWALDHEAAGLLIDTAQKDGRHLFAWLDEQTLAGVIERARRAGMMVALAGSIDLSSIRRALRLHPSVVAVRGAACSAGNRTDAIDPERVDELARIIAAHNVVLETAGECHQMTRRQ